MPPPLSQKMLADLLAEQRELEEQVHELRLSARQILAVGQALIAFSRREDEVFSGATPLVEPAVQQDLAREHRQLEDDLQLLEWLLNTTPDSPDILVLTVSLRTRMRQHVDRDGRLLSRAACMIK